MKRFIILMLTVFPWMPTAVSAQDTGDESSSKTGDATSVKTGDDTSSKTVDEAPAKAPAADAEEEKSEGWEKSFEMNFASAYVWRGLNLLGQGNQHYSPGVFLPGVEATRGIWTIGWVAAFQLGGRNVASNVDGAAGMEQDFYVQVEKTLTGDFSWTASLTAYGFPASKEAESGADRSLYAEPSVGITWARKFNPFVKIHWFHGVQSALSDFDYVYFNVGGSRDVKLPGKLTLKLAGEGGMKWFFPDDTVKDNVWDIQLGAVLEYAATDEISLTGGLGTAWSNFAGVKPMDEATAWLAGGICISW